MCLPKHQGGLGFRDIALFNQALLAKQAWRLLQNPNCLFSKLIKSRYFPQSEFLDSCLGSRPSFGWRSIQHGRELLKHGLRKRVGNGESINVWTDYWLDDNGLRAPWIKNPIINIDLKVCDLIDARRRDWDIDKLQEQFYPDDVALIRANRPVVAVDDFWIWKHNRSGDFSVKSGYWLAAQLFKPDIIAAATQQPSINELKIQVWKLKTEPKIKVFLWKVLSGAIPVMDLLSLRGMKVDDRCQTCGLGGESIHHVLFGCAASRQIWAMSDYPSPLLGFEERSIYSNIAHFLVNKDNLRWPIELRKSFPWIIWRLWKNRNLLFFEGKCFSALDTIKKVREDVQDWFAAQEVEAERSLDPSRVLQPSGNVQGSCPSSLWKPPPTMWVKCNIGLSWSRRNLLAGVSWVLRDEWGVVLMHSRRAFINIRSRKEAQFLCLVWAVESMVSHRLCKVLFAVEDVVLVGVVNRPQAWPSYRFQSGEILSLLRSFEEWKLVVEDSSSNRGANMIAQSVTLECRLQSYVALSFPCWLWGVFNEEMTFPVSCGV
ncbi:Reverse transcriptase zinc-binding domain [Arabidopsis suecica]|uniref:Reverse transcriptase zinc-binding domain n=1 Tax=Arabidopsis suecica TaxID=45249 RepID=A0A8T2C3Q6_ARASU|nr:Reverse transcriptase zinc-binding domain [Arabidopsis suecica]